MFIGIRYAQLNIEAPSVVIVRFFGIFFMIVHMGQVFGNIISSSIIEAATIVNQSLLTDATEVDRTCGHAFGSVAMSSRAAENIGQLHQRVFLAVCGVYVCCTLVATMIVSMFLNSLHNQGKAAKVLNFKSHVLVMTARNMTKAKTLLLIPLTLFNGIEQAFIVGVFTKVQLMTFFGVIYCICQAYVGCGLGISQIGYVMTSFGIADAICSLVFGPLIKLFGRIPLFIFGAVNNMLMIFTLLVDFVFINIYFLLHT